MFTDNKNCIKLDEGIYVIKNSIDKDTVDKITNIVDNLIVLDNVNEAMDHVLDWYRGKTTPTIPELLSVWENLSEIIAPEFVTHPNMSLQVMKPGETMFVHSDSPGMDNDEQLTSTDKWSTCCIIDWGMVTYFGNWEGGEVYYPNIKAADGVSVLSYKPEPGDTVLHKTTHPYEHGVSEVISGRRYAYSNFVLKTEKNPGTFYNYGTEDHINRSKNIDKWLCPLWENPLFPGDKMITDLEEKNKIAELVKEKRKNN